MTLIQTQFFELLRSGLWGTAAEATLFDAQTDWKQLFRFSKAQALLGIVFDGVQTLPEEKRPPRQLYLQWCNALLQVEDNNRKINRELANVYDLFRENQIEPVLLKGQGVAQNYRQPLHRQCGDIDLYIGELYYELANRLLRQEATEEHEENYKHTCLLWHGVSVENHRVLAKLSSPGADRWFQKEVAWWHNTSLCRSVYIDECRVTVPPLTFEVAYLLVHAVLHFLNGGIGLRQVCDWVSLLHAQKKKIDYERVRELLDGWGLSKAAKAFGVLAVNRLGLPPEDLPMPYTDKDLKVADWLLDDIWTGGNFGHFDAKNKRPKGYWSGKWHTFTRSAKRCRQLGALAPAEARWHPFTLAYRSAKIQWNRLWK